MVNSFRPLYFYPLRKGLPDYSRYPVAINDRPSLHALTLHPMNFPNNTEFKLK
ncbi:hypothetical protein BFAG_03710 [Bacteroides fragilis 3_1_12]|uniref:Uncharacterized protein n=1 Tax=Bacteroides fragilis 3_1_12 TaxID=457424 RepID=A0ABN0BQA1_BACFG|nr:hypothetical protein BFAG_03710 [Bacteroides fragilis 3_1_12]